MYQDIDPDPTLSASGTVTVHKSVAVDEAGGAFTASLTVEVRIPDGTVVFTISYGGRGTRLEVGSTAHLQIPVAGTPAP